MIRSIGKTCFAYAYKLAAARRFVLPQTHGIVPFIVCYHRVVDNFERSASGTIPAMLISTRMLERQLEWLSKRFALLSLDEVGAQLESGQPFAKPAAAVTFDDGYSDVYHHAYPLLQRKGIPAAFFVVTGLVDSGRPQIFDRLYLLLKLIERRQLSIRLAVLRALKTTDADASSLAGFNLSTDDPFTVMTAVLKSFPQQQIEKAIAVLEEEVCSEQPICKEMIPLSWDMVETMHRGGMTIGSHTHSHPLLTAESIPSAQRELVDSKQILEGRLKAAVRHFAYPDGRHNPAVVDAVSRAGYHFGYGICPSRDKKWPLLTIPRKVLWERACLNVFGRFSSAVMNCQVNWAFDTKGCEHNHSHTHEEITHAAIC
jgi:peptidoglycan/xylan/chitin deacetylase (PgdA/CDA1 family)